MNTLGLLCLLTPNFIVKRCFNENNKKAFREKLLSQNWETVYELDKELVDKQWEEFMRIFMNNFNIIYPFKKIPVKILIKLKTNNNYLRYGNVKPS